ncbi:acetolactate synthase, small subunit [Rubritalea squalenifaciens DSM 18772]|uniref:Acetolactate synthase small subunit n=2 Tax=Rubritalea TaxID=361050 RepID=A0A1M6HIS2_9BACT|nr:acetolactate synthase small subunit [Rubritalea squalenifaciens]SHJ22090.1 acetolactate synthase, small subunit [Rubritalea squalenifaciens DSM 18772]
MSKDIVTTDTPQNGSPDISQHSLSVYVNNTPGVLMRITQVFARRGFNIDSLVVSEGRDERFSRMTIGITGSSNGLEQIIKQVTKLIDVIHCSEHKAENSVVKELLLIKFIADSSERRTEALQIIDHFGGKTVDLTPKSMIAMITGDTPKIDSAIRLLSDFDIIETVRTGKVVMVRGGSTT